MNHIIKESIEKLEEIKEDIKEYMKDNTTVEYSAFNSEFNIERKLIGDISSITEKETYQRLIK